MNKILKNHLPVALLSIIAEIPVIIWASMEPIRYRFADIMTSATSLGQLAGILGLVFFSLATILSARIKIFDRIFGGINRAYIEHHKIGKIAFFLIIAHPISFAIGIASISFKEAILFLIPGAGKWEINFGIFALWLLVLLLIITFYRENLRIKYRAWKLSHWFLGVAFGFGITHAYLIRSDISENIFLRYYIFTLSSLGAISFLYRSVFGKLLVKRFDYTVKEIKSLKENIIEISLEPKNKALKSTPGQFIFISFLSSAVSREVHPFSISSGENEQILRITPKSLGDYTSLLRNLKIGDSAKIEGPYGRFSYRNFKNRNQIWVAGGIGITPFLSMIRSLKANEDYLIDFYYSANSADEFIFEDEIKKIGENNKNIKITFWNASERGFISAWEIKKAVGDFLGREIFVCGPPVMMNALKKQFKDLGVKKENIHSEEFSIQ